MGIYADGVKYKLIVQGTSFNLKAYSPSPITNGIRLLSSDDYILTDTNGLYLTTETEVE